jgi:hypothetical protein
MQVILKYERSTGAIRGIFASGVGGMLDAQIVQDDPDFGYLRHDTEDAAEALQRGYYVREDLLVAKTLLTLTTTPNPFAADAVTVCTVTVEPFVSCTVLVDSVPYALIEEDPTVELTSNVPHRFQIALAPVAAYMADPVTVEAT